MAENKPIVITEEENLEELKKKNKELKLNKD